MPVNPGAGLSMATTMTFMNTAIIHPATAQRRTTSIVIATGIRHHYIPAARVVTLAERLTMTEELVSMTLIQIVLGFGTKVNATLYTAISLMHQRAQETMTLAQINVLSTSFLLLLLVQLVIKLN
jgi:hypothetical protein